MYHDLRKAFDLVDTDVLLQKLSLYQCDPVTLKWFKSYLQGREQCVLFKGHLSSTKSVTHGVPQGSILGPLLFVTFMNDLPLYVDSPLDMYADDSTLYVTGESIEELESKINADLQHVQQWCQTNKMAINADKTKVMLVTTHQKQTKLPSSVINVHLNDTLLENVNAEKLLGVVIDKHLSWKDHINKTAKTISRNIALLRRIRKYLPHKTRITFYKSFIQPHVDYCNTIWGQSPHVSRIHILQKMALRLIMDVPRLTHSAPLM
jgi:ribonuclease P/MRP protein subunit RPP40